MCAENTNISCLKVSEDGGDDDDSMEVERLSYTDMTDACISVGIPQFVTTVTVTQKDAFCYANSIAMILQM